MQSLFTRFSDSIGHLFSGNTREDIIDSSSKTVRSDYINATIADLYLNAWATDFRKSWGRLIFGAFGRFPVIFNIPDSSRYTANGKMYELVDDVWLRQNLYCYEQIIPLNLQSKRKEYMKEDLNRYFGYLYGTTVHVEQKKIECYKIVRIGSLAKIKSKGGSCITYGSDKKNTVTVFKDTDLTTPLRAMCYSIFPNEATIVSDETHYTGNVDISYPKNLNNVADFRKILNAYGLDIVKSEIFLPFLVFDEKQNELKKAE
jgi:hypothetical protein